MPRTLEHYTQVARRDVSAEVVAAVPVRNGVPLPENGTWNFLQTDPRVTGPYGTLELLLPFRFHPAVFERARTVPTVMVFHPGHVSLHGYRRIRRSLGPVEETRSLRGATYRRQAMAVETILCIDGEDWLVNGWYERELREVLRRLGHADALEELT